jgi:hypothetical protein
MVNTYVQQMNIVTNKVCRISCEQARKMLKTVIQLSTVYYSYKRWIDNFKMDLLEIGFSLVDWIGLAQNRYRWRAIVNSVMNLRFP